MKTEIDEVAVGTTQVETPVEAPKLYEYKEVEVPEDTGISDEVPPTKLADLQRDMESLRADNQRIAMENEKLKEWLQAGQSHGNSETGETEEDDWEEVDPSARKILKKLADENRSMKQNLNEVRSELKNQLEQYQVMSEKERLVAQVESVAETVKDKWGNLITKRDIMDKMREMRTLDVKKALAATVREKTQALRELGFVHRVEKDSRPPEIPGHHEHYARPSMQPAKLPESRDELDKLIADLTKHHFSED